MIELAAAQNWLVGYQDECWWSRLAQPNLHSWSADGKGLRLHQKSPDRTDLEPKALCCYGLLRQDNAAMLLRFVTAQPNSASTIAYLAWLSDTLAAQGHSRLVIVWDNATWHKSRAVRTWLKAHNQAATGRQGGFDHHSMLVAGAKPLAQPD